MEARDLRIGDVVMTNWKPLGTIKGKFYIVTKVDSERQALGYGVYLRRCATIVDMKKSGRYIGSAWIDYLEPIPVTVELLEKLGFKEKEYRYSLNLKYDLDLGDGFIQISDLSNSVGKNWYVHIDNSDHETIGGMDFQYLHELQHIIWDCLHIELNTEKL